MASAHPTAVLHQILVARVLHRAQAQQPRVVTETSQQLRLAHSLRGFATNAANADQRISAMPVCAVHLFRCQREHRLQQAHLRIPNRKLRRMHCNSKPVHSGIHVVPREGALPALVQGASSVERQRMCRDCGAGFQSLTHLCFGISHARAFHTRRPQQRLRECSEHLPSGSFRWP